MAGRLIAALAIVLVTATTAVAQDARETLQRKTRPGDTLTVDLGDKSSIQGCLVTAGADVLTLDTLGGQVSLPYSKIDRVRRRHNGVVLGTLIGAVAGVSWGLVLRNALENEGEDGDGPFILTAATGIGVGLGFDALWSSNREVYRRSATTVGVELAPRPRGVSAGVRVRW